MQYSGPKLDARFAHSHRFVILQLGNRHLFTASLAKQSTTVTTMRTGRGTEQTEFRLAFHTTVDDLVGKPGQLETENREREVIVASDA